MKFLLFSALLLAFYAPTLNYPCGDCSSSCCVRNRPSCCTSGSSCCSNESSCCTRGSSCCANTSTNKSCCNNTETTPYISDSPYYNKTINVRNNASNSNNNSITIPTNINIQNEIRSENHVSIPVSVNVNNMNNINLRPASENCRSGDKCENRTVVTSPAPAPLPIYENISVPYTKTIVMPILVPVGCCQVVHPCVPYAYGGCQMSATHCSQQCSGSHVYQPINVCNTGCFRRNRAMGFQCEYDSCSRNEIDCSMCNNDFYSDYAMFVMCAGCFIPMPWRQAG